MQLLYFITTVTSQVHSARHHQLAGYSTLPSVKLLYVIHWKYTNCRGGGGGCLFAFSSTCSIMFTTPCVHVQQVKAFGLGIHVDICLCAKKRELGSDYLKF